MAIKHHSNENFLDSNRLIFGTGLDASLYVHGDNLYIDQDTADKDIIFRCDDGSGGTTTYFTLDGSSATHDGSATTSMYTQWGDNSIIALGDAKDFSMYHTGSKTLLNNSTGNLEIRNSADDSDIIFQSDDGSGGVTTYFELDGSASLLKAYKDFKLLDGVRSFYGDSSDLQIQHDGSHSYISQSGTGNLYIQQNTNDADLILQCDDGSGGTTAYLTLDGSAETVEVAKPLNITGNLQVDGTITTGTTAAMTSAGLLSVAAQTNITSLGTLTALTVDDITINGDTITASADLNIVATGNDIDIDTDNFTLESSGGNKPNFTLKSTSSGNKPVTFNFIKDKGAAGAANDAVGVIQYTSDNDAQEQITIATTLATVADATDGAEEGQYFINIKNTSSSGTLAALSLTGNGAATDATIGYGTGSVTTIAGTLTMGSTATLDNSGNLLTNAATATNLVASTSTAVQLGTVELGHASDTTIARSAAGIVTIEGNKVVTENKQLHVIPSNFFDDIGTTKHYVPLSSQSTAEQTGDGNTVTDFLCPCSTKVKEVMVKLPSSTTGSGDLTVGIETVIIGTIPSSKSIIETETVTVASSNDNDIVHFIFDDTTHATIGQNLSISIQSDTDLSGSSNWYVVTILEFDWSTRHTSGSAVQTS